MKKYKLLLCLLLIVVAGIVIWFELLAAPYQFSRLKVEDVERAGFYKTYEQTVAVVLDEQETAKLVALLSKSKIKRDLEYHGKLGILGGSSSFLPVFLELKKGKIMEFTVYGRFIIFNGKRYVCDEQTKEVLWEYLEKYYDQLILQK